MSDAYREEVGTDSNDQMTAARLSKDARQILTTAGDIPGDFVIGALLFSDYKNASLLVRTIVDVPPANEMTHQTAYNIGMALINLSRVCAQVHQDLKGCLEGNPALLQAAVMGMSDAAKAINSKIETIQTQ